MNKWQLQDKLFNLYCLVYLIDMYVNDHKTAEARRTVQNKRLQKLMKSAYGNPFYKERFKKVGALPEDFKTKADLAKFPILTKAEYRDWMCEELKKDEVQYFKLTYTSGSTGIPTTNIFPPTEYAKHYMMDMFCWIRGGYNPFTGKTLTCAPGDASVGMNSFIQKLGFLRRDCFSMEWGRERIVNKINEYKPDFILGYSAELIYIAEYCIENNISIHKPQYYCAGGEHVEGISEKVLKEVFGQNMINYYGCTEMADFAYRVPGNNGYSIIEDSVVVTVNTEKGIQNAGLGSVLATPLYRTYYPLINYEIGDIILLEEKNGVDYIAEIDGRKQDVFYWKSGKRTTHKDLWQITRTLEDIYQIRFIQESFERVVIQVVKDYKSEKTCEELESGLINLFKKQFDTNTEILFEWLSVIPPDPNGKIRNMISRVND